MVLLIITYLAGALTILSPCILPVLPLVFSKTRSSFWKSRFPLLLGMAATFALFSGIALVGGEWISRANDIGRWLALVFITLFGVSLLFPSLLDSFFASFSRVGSKIGQNAKDDNPLGSLLIGISTGLLWAPCAGPILGLVLTGAATQKDAASSIVLLFSYSLGAATSLALALLAGNRLMRNFKTIFGINQIIKKVIGVTVLLGVAIIFFKLDRTLLTQISKIGTDSVENKLLKIAGLQQTTMYPSAIPPFEKNATWLNTEPLDVTALRGKVVLIDFWTYSCINCLRTLPHLKAWHEKYQKDGLVIVGIHTPEFAFEKKLDNVTAAVSELGITYPVVTDNSYTMWRAFKNRYWPAHYFVDRQGHIRHHHFGEGQYKESEEIIRKLLAEDGTDISDQQVSPPTVLHEPSNFANVKSPETYLGYARTKNFSSDSPLQKDTFFAYKTSNSLSLNQWALEGAWVVEKERARSESSNAKIMFHFQARDLHLVLGSLGKTVVFKIRIDGKVPGVQHGVDVDAEGVGQIKDHRLYQLIRLQDSEIAKPHLFEIEFLSPGAEAYAFTFG